MLKYHKYKIIFVLKLFIYKHSNILMIYLYFRKVFIALH